MRREKVRAEVKGRCEGGQEGEEGRGVVGGHTLKPAGRTAGNREKEGGREEQRDGWMEGGSEGGK